MPVPVAFTAGLVRRVGCVTPANLVQRQGGTGTEHPLVVDGQLGVGAGVFD